MTLPTILTDVFLVAAVVAFVVVPAWWEWRR